jgi:hypothetical protein
MTKEESNFVSYDSLNWGGLTAASPLRHMVRWLTFGALKG